MTSMRSSRVLRRSSATNSILCAFAPCPTRMQRGSRRCAMSGRRRFPRCRSSSSNAAWTRSASGSSSFGPTATLGRVGSCRRGTRNGSRRRRSTPDRADASPSPCASTMVNLLSNMIDTIKSTVDAAHTVNEKSHIVRCPVHPQIRESAEPLVGAPFRNVTVIDGYYHEERGQILAFFDAQQGANPCEQPSGHEGEALAAAQQAHAQGVTDELAFIGIP